MLSIKRIVKLDDIIIQESMLQSPPKQKKMKQKNKEYERGKLKGFIVLNKKNELLDGYATYLVLKQHNEESVECYYHLTESECKYNVYVFGKHYLDNENEYVWYLPRNMWDEVENIKSGDKILVRTKNGVVPAYVTKVKKSYTCPAPSYADLKRVIKIKNVK